MPLVPPVTRNVLSLNLILFVSLFIPPYSENSNPLRTWYLSSLPRLAQAGEHPNARGSCPFHRTERCRHPQFPCRINSSSAREQRLSPHRWRRASPRSEGGRPS